MAGFDHQDDRLAHEAEELMRQRRFQDAVERYGDLQARMPTDLWTTLGRVSALECAGLVDEARSVLEQLDTSHRRSASFQRFRHLFFVRREDFKAASASQRALRSDVVDEGPDDQLADLYFNQGRYIEARSEFERLLAADLDESELKASTQARLGACLRQLGDAAAAREQLRSALTLDPGNHWTLAELAESERALGEVDAARTRYREALEAAPDDHWTRGHLAQLEFEDGNHAEAIRLYEAIIEAQPKAAWAKVELAQALTEGDPARSAALCAEAIDLDPRNPWAHAQRGALARRADRLSEARDHFLFALQGAPSAVWVLHELADTCRHLGRQQEAYAHLDRARAEDPYHAVTYGYYADLLRHDNRHAEALANLAKALELDPAYAWAWRERAELSALAARHDQAHEAWTKACELEPDAPINDGLKAFLLRAKDQRDAAGPYLDRAVERNPGYLWAWRERLEHLLAVERNLEAIQVGQRAVVAIPDAAPLWGMLAEARRRLSQRDPAMRGQAAQDVEKAIALDRSIPQLWAIRAELAAERGELPLAEESAREAVAQAAKQGGGVEYEALLAQVFTAAGRTAEAETLLAAILPRAAALQPAWELAAALAERRGDQAAARALCDRALAGPLANELRLRVRRARLGIQLGENPRTLASGFDAVFTPPAAGPASSSASAAAPITVEAAAGGHVPWRDLAHIFALAERPLDARRAIHLAVEAAGTDEQAQRRAQVHLAELELALGNHSGAASALNGVLQHEPEHLQARILGAALADHRGDHPTALAHLTQLERSVRTLLEPAVANDAQPHDQVPPPLLRQLASLYERTGDQGRAQQVWERLLTSSALAADNPERHDLVADHLAFQIRRHGPAEAAAAVTEARLPRGSAAHQRVLRELAMALANSGDAAAGLRGLLADDDVLDHDSRLLLARLALSAGEADTARRHLELLLPITSGETSDAARVLLARARLATGDTDGGDAAARALWLERGRMHEEAATILGECLACSGHFIEALAVLEDAALPAQPSLERALLTGLIALEELGPAWALAALARHGRPSADAHRLPVVRVLTAAWPGAWATLQAQRESTVISSRDLTAVPPFPRLAERLAAALIATGHAELAAAHVLAVLAFHRTHGAPRTGRLARSLRLAAVNAQCHAGQRGPALLTALRGADPLAFMLVVSRCLGPNRP